MPVAELPVTKVCTRCGEDKPLDAYGPHPAGKFGRNPRCQQCKRDVSKGYYQRWTPEQRDLHKARVARHRYGIDIATYRALIEQPCDVCGREGSSRGRVCIDHDHGTGTVRGVLCTECNLAVGYLRDDPALVQSVLDYLQRG